MVNMAPPEETVFQWNAPNEQQECLPQGIHLVILDPLADEGRGCCDMK